MFLIALGTIMGAAIVDMALIAAATRACGRSRRDRRAATAEAQDWKRVAHARASSLWVVCWGVAVVVVGHLVLGQPVGYLVLGRGCSCSSSRWSTASRSASRDSNPISSAFVVSRGHDGARSG